VLVRDGVGLVNDGKALAKGLEASVQEVQPTLTNLNASSAHLRRLMASLDNPKVVGDLQQTMANAERLTAQWEAVGGDVHRLTGEGDSITFDLRANGTGLQQVLGAIYALERLDAPLRRALVPMMRRSLVWRGPLGANFIAHLAGTTSSSVAALADPRAWALDVLGFPAGTVKPSKREIMSRFRESMRRAHPDHGGNSATAAKVMSEITEARRVLLDSL